MLRQLRDIEGADFEAVDVSSLMVDPDSGLAGAGVTFSNFIWLPLALYFP